MLILFLGAALVAYGAWVFFDKRAAPYFGGTYGRVFARTTLPMAIGLFLFAAGGIAGAGEWRAILYVLGACAIVFSWFLYYVHPRWAQPRWMRSRDD